jgi:hypothetical protein
MTKVKAILWGLALLAGAAGGAVYLGVIGMLVNMLVRW